MRYTEQLKSSWGYHWRLFREIWDMFTLRGWHWLIVGLLVVLCVMPCVAAICTPVIGYYVNTPVPPFDPTVPYDISYELALKHYYYFIIPEPPQLWAVINYHWVANSALVPLVQVLCLMSAGLLLVAYLREGNPVRGREG